MVRYFLNRLLLIIPTFLGVTLLLFALTRLVPGGPLEQALMSHQLGSNEGGAKATKGSGSLLNDEQLADLRAYYGLDKPIEVAYPEWLGKLLQLDLGKSSRYGDPVGEMILERVPISLWFGLTSIVLVYLISIPLGIRKALKHGRLFDNASSSLLFVAYAIPGYIVGMMLLWFLAFGLQWFPIGGFQSRDFETMDFWGQMADRVHHMALPLAAYVIGDFAVLTLTMKNNLMENMAADYVRTAVAKGRTFGDALWFHAFRNSLIPMASGFGAIITVFLSGSFLIEQVFNIRGMGLLGYNALVGQDYPVVMGVLAITALLSLVGNVLGDLFVSLVDPRVRFGK